jgi:hypothetical protein
MSSLSESARSKAREKAERLVRSSPGKIDASGWQEPLGEKGNIQTGPRVLSRDNYRRGGKVAGHAGVAHYGRKPRASGGRAFADALVNRDVKEANQDRPGEKHRGGMARGGHADAAQDRKLIHEMGCKCAKCSGGRVGKAAGGSLDGTIQGMRPQGGRLARKSGGRSKKGMNVNIIIAPAQSPRAAMPPPGALPAPGGGPLGMHQGAPPPMPPPGAAAAGAPPAMMPRARGGRASDGVLAKPGKYPLKDGGGGGLGRLEKQKAYGSNATSLK